MKRYRWLGLGALPDDAVLRYVIRGGALVQAAIGVLIWIIASDVIRYRPLVLALGGIYLICGPAFNSWIWWVLGRYGQCRMSCHRYCNSGDSPT